MFKLYRFALAIGLLVTLLAQPAMAAEPFISPFGPIEWEDGVLEMIQKMDATKPESIILKSGRDEVSLKGVKTREQLEAKFVALFQSMGGSYLNPKDPRNRYNLSSFKGKDGQERIFLNKGFSIVVNPVVIKGTSFMLTITLASSPGFALAKPDAVVHLKKSGYYYPLFVGQVSLDSTSPKLNETEALITQIIQKKYAPFKTFTDRVFIDPKDTKLQIWPDTRSYKINYSSEYYSQKYAELYQKHLSALETAKLSEKQELSGGL